MAVSGVPRRGIMFWPVGTGDSSTIVVDEGHVIQVDLHDIMRSLTVAGAAQVGSSWRTRLPVSRLTAHDVKTRAGTKVPQV